MLPHGFMNPFSVAIAQGIANVPVLSGSLFRITMWAVFTASIMIYSVVYARSIQNNPRKSLSHDSDNYFREQLAEINVKQHFGFVFG